MAPIERDSKLAKAEKTAAYEIGLKSAWLDKTMIFNADLFLTNISNYQQGVKEIDPTSDPANPTYSSYTGNAPKVQAARGRRRL